MRLRVNKRKLYSVLTIVVVVGASIGLGYIGGYYDATGLIPTFRESEPIIPPSEVSVVSASEAEDTIAILRDKEYGEGYNCVDYAWEAMRLLRWEGQPSVIIRLSLEPEPDHVILLVPTKDKGWIFIEPQTGTQVKPTVGGKYDIGQFIEAIDVMTIEWLPIEDFLNSPALNTMEGE